MKKIGWISTILLLVGLFGCELPHHKACLGSWHQDLDKGSRLAEIEFSEDGKYRFSLKKEVGGEWLSYYGESGRYSVGISGTLEMTIDAIAKPDEKVGNVNPSEGPSVGETLYGELYVKDSLLHLWVDRNGDKSDEDPDENFVLAKIL